MSQAPRQEPGPVVRREVVSFARRDGRIHPRIAKAWSARAAALEIRPCRLDRDASLDPEWVLDPVAVFGRQAPLVAEIGSGTGEAILTAAAADPDRDYLAVEVYRPGAAKTMIRAERQGLTNVRVLQADAAALLRTGLAPASVAEIRVFFPDPWHKTKHHKRRLVTDDMLADVARVLIDDGILRLATDWADYGAQMLEATARATDLINPHDGPAPRFAGRPLTRFERKGIAAGRSVTELEMRRRPRRMSIKNMP